MPHKIALFFENHYDPATILAITNNLQYLKGKGYNTICLEDFANKNLKQIIQEKSEYKAKLEAYFTAITDKDSDGYYLLQRAYENIEVELSFFNQVLSQGFNFATIDVTTKSINTHIKSCKNDDDCVQGLNGKGIAFFNHRNQIFADNIDKAANKYDKGVIAIIGHRHYDIQLLLKSKGYDKIKSFYINQYPTDFDYEKTLRGDDMEGQKYRNDHFPLGLHVMDLYAHPEINIEKELKEVLTYAGEHDKKYADEL